MMLATASSRVDNTHHEPLFLIEEARSSPRWSVLSPESCGYRSADAFGLRTIAVVE